MNCRFIIRINPAKAVFAFSFLYTNIIAVKLFAVPGLSFGLLALSFLLAISTRRKNMNEVFRERSIILYFIFVLITSITSVLVSNDLYVALSSINALIEYGMMLIIIVTFSLEDGNVDYSINLFLLYALISCILLFIAPKPFTDTISRTIYLTIAPGVNPHTVGMVLAIGIWCCMMKLGQGRRKSIWEVIISVALMIAMFAAAILTNSRKTILGIALIVIFSVIPYLQTAVKRMSSIGRLLFPAIFFASLLYFFINPQLFISFFEKNDILLRFQEMNGSSNQSRIAMIIEALNVFCENPIFGVGLNNFREYSSYQTYSHNTYSEILACCGIVGTIPFAYMIGKTFIPIFVRKVGSKNNQIAGYTKRMFCILVVLILYAGFSQIIIYGREFMYAIALCIAYNMLQKRENFIT